MNRQHKLFIHHRFKIGDRVKVAPFYFHQFSPADQEILIGEGVIVEYLYARRWMDVKFPLTILTLEPYEMLRA